MACKPKEIHPNQLAMLCQRTIDRRYFFAPTAPNRELFGYMLGKSLHDHDMDICVGFLMPNHFHLMVYDRHGNRDAMMQQALSNAARKRNLELDKRDKLWSSSRLNDMAVLDAAKALEQVLYVALQAVAAGLIERGGEREGFMVLPRHWGKPMRFHRHKYCADDMPETVEFTPMPPPGFEHLELQEAIDFFENLIAEKELEYKKRRKGAPVLGIDVVASRNPFWTPSTPSPMGQLNPTFTSSDPVRIRKAIERIKEFNKWHRQALTEFRKGKRNVEFPAGTVQMSRLAGCRSATAAADHPFHYDKTWSNELQSSWDTWLKTR